MPRPRHSRRFPWEGWSNGELLDLRLCDLGLSIRGTWLEEPVEALHAEIEARGLRPRPHVWLSTEWFCPDGVAGIAVPFYLAHPRLMRLERTQMLEVEGGHPRECLKLFRHEAGHAIHHAFKLQRRRRWWQLFGPSSTPYPKVYRPNPASKRYVTHLDLWYAQAHPDEDFAETFAVWLAPRSGWRKRYAGWPAVKKLEYVDELMAELAGQTPLVRSRRHVEPVSALRVTLREHYREKRQRYAPKHTDIYDKELREIFADGRRTRRGEPAASFLRRHRGEIRRRVRRWASDHVVALDRVLEDMIGRCGDLRLRAVRAERRLLEDFTVLLTVKTMQYLYRVREWHTL